MSSMIKKSIIPLLAISSAYLYLKPTNPAFLESDVLLDGYKVLSQQRIVAIGGYETNHCRNILIQIQAIYMVIINVHLTRLELLSLLTTMITGLVIKLYLFKLEISQTEGMC